MRAPQEHEPEGAVESKESAFSSGEGDVITDKELSRLIVVKPVSGGGWDAGRRGEGCWRIVERRKQARGREG
jgi:hypothetical protein